MFYIAYVEQHQEEIMGEMRNVITEFQIGKLYNTKAAAEQRARKFRIKHYPHAQEKIQVLKIQHTGVDTRARARYTVGEELGNT